MTIDELGRTAAWQLRTRIDGVDVPDGRSVVDRFRRRRLARAGVAVVVVVLGAGIATSGRDPAPTSVHMTDGLPAGSVTAEGWASVPKAAAGLRTGTIQQAVASGDGVAVAGGGAGSRAVIWWTTDGLRWQAAEVPDQRGTVMAIALDGRGGIATGASGEDAGRTTFLWRTDDAGRTWSAIDAVDPFGAPAPQMGRPFVDGLQRVGGDWVATGGASSGWAGIWTSRDGARWTKVLDSHDGGSVNVVGLGGGRLLGWWTSVTWSATDPHVWGQAKDTAIADQQYPLTVAPGATVAFADRLDVHGQPTALLRGSGDGRRWSEEPSFLDRFPDAHVRRVTRVDGLYVAAGEADGHVAAWTSTDGNSWVPLPPGLLGPPGGVLELVVPIAGKLVVLGTAPELDRYYVRGVGPVRCPGSLVIDQHTGGDGLPAVASRTSDRAHVEQVLRDAKQRLRRTYPGIAGLAVGPGGGHAWDRTPGSEVVVRHTPDYAIHVTLERASDCPSSPNGSIDGVPLVFLAP
ncbi:MAG: hypothetical protein JWN67_81 [Actinomycetia bacterium]|nr:hypothetical protein [Actinomycetes bacterium]